MFSWYTGSILAVNLDILHCGQTQIDLSVLQAMFSCLPLQARVCEILSYVSHWKQLSLFSQSCLTLCDPMDCSTPGFPVLHCLLEFAQTHVCWVGDAFQLSHPLLLLSPPALNLSQHQGLFQWVSSSHQEAKVLELQPQHQSFQWIFRLDFL